MPQTSHLSRTGRGALKPDEARSVPQRFLDLFLDATWKIQTERLVAARAEQSSGAARTGTDDDGR